MNTDHPHPGHPLAAEPETDPRLRTRRPRTVLRAMVVLAAIGVAMGSVSACGTTQRQAGSADAAVVDTVSGPVRGTVTAEHRSFTGIPYAAAPVGELRWRPPAAPAHWGGTRDATAPGARCPQSQAAFNGSGSAESEDCLFLNVWTPARAAEKKRPVMVWVHGGSFKTGSGDLYDPSRLVAAGDMVVVTINYRLGALGFLAHPALAHDDGQVGNFGLMDQQAALRWVRDNITAFGGDPTRVTLAGESAGAISVCDHLASPASAGLFRAAIMQSGPCAYSTTRQSAVGISEDYATTLGCPGTDPTAVAECLRATSIEKLIANPLVYNTISGVDFPEPVTGQPLLPTDPITAMRAGEAAKVPVLIGTNHDEFTTLVAEQDFTTHQLDTAGQYLQELTRAFGPSTDKVAALYALYPAADYADPTAARVAVFTDYAFACPAAEIASSLTHTGPVYQYEFDDRHAAVPDAPAPPFPLGAGHALELPYLFDVTGLPHPPTPAQQHLSTQMIGYWTAFVNTTNPHTPDQPDWPSHTSNQVLTLRPDDTTTSTDFTNQHHCNQWASIPTP